MSETEHIGSFSIGERTFFCDVDEQYPPTRCFQEVEFGFALYSLALIKSRHQFRHQGVVQSADEALLWCRGELGADAINVIRIYPAKKKIKTDD